MFNKKKLPELYTEREIDAIETHIVSYYGKYKKVFHNRL